MERTFPSPSLFSRVVRVLCALFLAAVAFASGVDAAQFTLTWSDNSTNETGFRIERAAGLNATSGFAEIATVGANVVSYVDTGLPNSTAFSYRLRAYNAAGNSGYSNVATGMTPPLLSNNAPTISNIANRFIPADGTTGVIPFSIGDVETPAGSLVVTVNSSNTTLAPLSGVSLGGTGASRTIAVAPASGRTGSATITVTVSDGQLSSSDSFVLTVNAVGAGPSIAVQPQPSAIAPGNSLTLGVSAAGAGAVTYQWYFNDTAIGGATGASYTIPIAQRTHAGAYHVVVTAGGVSVTSQVATVSAGTTATVGRLVNLSSRAPILTDDKLLIPGFVVSGNTSKRLVLRVVGPGLAPFGLPGLLADPKLVLKKLVAGAYVDVASNLDWADGGDSATVKQVSREVGAFDLSDGSNDAVLVTTLAPGQYSVFATDEQADRTGLAMVEVYDADAVVTGTNLSNASTRGHLGAGSNVMITGFVIEDGPMTLLVRTIGPGLSALGVAGAIDDPVMDLHASIAGADVVLASNDDWGASPDAAYTEQIRQQVGGFALSPGSRDAACVVTLPAGSYTVISKGANASTGLGLVEIYVVR